MAACSAASTRSAASASMPGRTWLYKSSVIPILEWPRRSLEHVGGVGMAQIVKSDARQGRVGELANPILRQTIGLQWRAVLLRHDERIIRQPDADL